MSPTHTLFGDQIPEPGDKELKDYALPPEVLASICEDTGRIAANLRLALPYFKGMLASTRKHAAGSPEGFAEKLERDFHLLGMMVRMFDTMHERNCVSDTSNTMTIGNPAKTSRGVAQVQPKRKTVMLSDFRELLFAIPLHTLLEIGIIRAEEFDKTEKEYFRKQSEMAAYVEQVRKYGLAGGRKLIDPSEWWDKRTEESGFWQQEIFKKDGEGKE